MQAAADLGEIRTERPEPGVAVVVLAGEHDLASRPALEDLFAKLLAENELVLADFSEATFVDSSVVHVVLDANRTARRERRTFRLQLDGNAIVWKAFEICGALSVVDCVSTRRDGLKSPRR